MGAGSIETKLQREEEVNQLKEKTKEIGLKNREMQRAVNEKSKEIEAKSNSEDSNDLKIIMEQLRTSKEKLKEMETRYQGEVQRSQMIQAKIAELEKTAKELGIDVAALNQPKQAKIKSGGEIKAKPQNKEVAAVKEVILELEKNKQNVIAQAKKKCAELEETKIAIAEEVSKLVKLAKDKEHECKLKEYEIKELKRTQRNLQMKLVSAPEINIESDKPKIGKNSHEAVEEDKPREELKKPRKLSTHDEEEKREKVREKDSSDSEN